MASKPKSGSQRSSVLHGPLSDILTKSSDFISEVQDCQSENVQIVNIQPTRIKRQARYSYYPCRKPQEENDEDLLTILAMLRDTEITADMDLICGLVFSYFVGIDEGLLKPLKDAFTSHNIDFAKTDMKACREQYKEKVNAMQDEMVRIDHRHFLAIFSVMVLWASKNLSADNYERWSTSRFRGACAKAGVPEDKGKFKSMTPGVIPVAQFYDRVTSFWRARTVMTDYLVAAKEVEGIQGTMALWTLNLLEWAECTHIRAILNELVIKRPDMLAISEFRSELPHLKGSLQYLKSLGNRYPHCKLITDPSSKNPLNSVNFKLMSAVAWALQEKHLKPGGVRSETNYKGMRVSPEDPLFISAMAKIKYYDKLLKVSERNTFVDTFGNERVAEYEQELKDGMFEED